MRTWLGGPALALCLCAALAPAAQAAGRGAAAPAACPRPLRLESVAAPTRVSPLGALTLLDVPGRMLTVSDSAGREYVRVPAAQRVAFVVGGAVGEHTARALDGEGRELASLRFVVEAATAIEDEGGAARDLLALAKKSLWCYGGPQSVTWRGQTYRYYVTWIRDHVHTLKGMKYFDAAPQEALDLYRESQREDGMIWDFLGSVRGPRGNFYDTAYGPLGYARWYEDVQFGRMPLEADNEYLFIEGLYFAWKATGDDAWLGRQLEAGRRALEYSVTDPARWSQKLELIKRGYTIDTWDFAVDDPTTRGLFPRWHTLLVDPLKTRFGIMFGDNTGYAASCGYLAEMLEHVGRGAEAATYRERARQIRERLDGLAWTGTHFRHRVEEDPQVTHDLGVDEAQQVSLSNAYSLNRGIRHDQATAILRTYQRLRDNLPPGGPGEWFGIWPPFQRGFGEHSELYQYINGAVLPLVAGELAHGAFEHGFEEYGADVLRRLLALGQQHGDYLHFSYTGAFPETPAPQYTPVDLSRVATMDTGGQGAPGVSCWMDTRPDDHVSELPTGRQILGGVPFLITDAARNGRRAAIAVARRKGFPEQVELPLGRQAASIVLLHTAGETKETRVAGAVTFRYADGSQASHYLIAGTNVFHWWYPEDRPAQRGWGDFYGAPRTPPAVTLAWRGRNDICPSIGLHAYALNNPEPEKVVRSLVFSAALDGAIYAVAGLALGDRPVQKRAGPVSFGGPDNWGAGAVVYALAEGLAGVVDREVAYRKVLVAPRWPAAGIAKVKVTIHYPASNGYLTYDYAHEAERREIKLTLTGSGETAALHVLLPAGATRLVSVEDESGALLAARLATVESSRYADFDLPLPGPRTVRVMYGVD